MGTRRIWAIDVSPSTTVLTGNGSSSGNVLGSPSGIALVSNGGGSVVSDDTHSQSGGLSAKLTVASPTAAACLIRCGVATAGPTQRFSWYDYAAALPSTTTTIWGGRPTTGYQARIDLKNDGTLQIKDSSNTVVGSTGTGAWEAGRQNRLELIISAAGASGYATLHTYDTNGTTIDGSVAVTNQNFGSADFLTADYGFVSAPTAGAVRWIDSIQTEDGTGPELGPYYIAASPAYPVNVTSNPGVWTFSDVAILDDLGDSDDATFITNPASANNETITLKMNPLLPGNVTAKVRVRLAFGQSAGLVKAELLQGATVIATWQQNITSTSYVDMAHTLTSGELSAVTDRNDLYIRLTANPV